MFKVQRFIFNGKSKYTWILMIHWYFEYSSLCDQYIIQVFSFALSLWYHGASVTLCARKIRNSWCSCPCCSRHFKITWLKNMGPDNNHVYPLIMSSRTLTSKYACTTWQSNTATQITGKIVRKHQTDQSHSFQTSVNKCRKVSERGVGVGEINWFWLNLVCFLIDIISVQPKTRLSIYN